MHNNDGSTEIICEGFAFIEGPRWHENALWFSDMHQEAVFRIIPGHPPEKVVTVANSPSGLGWLPNGDLLIASMLDKTVYRYQKSATLTPYADLSMIAERRINDMLVDQSGRAWVGNFGFLFHDGEEIAPGTLARIDNDGTVHAAAGGLMFANGMCVIPGTTTLVVAETFAGRLTAFDFDGNGELSNRRIWAQLPDGAVPDGICVDAEGAIWAASPTTGDVLRLVEGGEVTASINTGRQAIACALGGADGKTLFVSSAETTDREQCRKLMSANITATLVDVPAPLDIPVPSEP